MIAAEKENFFRMQWLKSSYTILYSVNSNLKNISFPYAFFFKYQNNHYNYIV